MPVFGGLEERPFYQTLPNLWVERAHQGDFLPFLFGCFYVVIVRRFLGLQSCGSSVWTLECSRWLITCLAPQQRWLQVPVWLKYRDGWANLSPHSLKPSFSLSGLWKLSPSGWRTFYMVSQSAQQELPGLPKAYFRNWHSITSATFSWIKEVTGQPRFTASRTIQGYDAKRPYHNILRWWITSIRFSNVY